MGKSRKSTIRKFEFYETITDNGIESGYVRLANTQFHSDAVMDLSANSYIIQWQNELLNARDEDGNAYSPTYLRTIQNQLSAIFNHGSDERMYAEQWYQRCWFAMFSDDTFLKFLLLWGDLDAYIDLMDELESNKKEMAEMTADAEEYSSEERDELHEYIHDLQKEKDYYWNKFLERKRQKESYVFEKEIENIMAWKSQLNTLLDTENL